MALTYAFTDRHGTRYGEPDDADSRIIEFAFTLEVGAFAGQQLIMRAASREGTASGTWLQASPTWGSYATVQVEDLLGLDPQTPRRLEA